MTAPIPIHLQAEDEDDLIVLSGLAQDMVVRVADMAYVAKARRFVVMGQRFCWEAASTDNPARIRSALRAESVTSVRARGFSPFESDVVLNLLSIRTQPSENGCQIDLLFSDDKSVRLQAEALDLWLEDVGQAYPVKSTPDHGVIG